MAQTPTSQLQLSRGKRTGILVLISLLLVLLALWLLLPAWLAPAPDQENLQLQAKWDKFKEEHTVTARAAEQASEEQAPDRQTGGGRAVTLFYFDPNTASEQELVTLGIPPGTAKTLIKYRSKGGKFYKKEDLRKLYTLKPGDYERLAPYVRIAGERDLGKEEHRYPAAGYADRIAAPEKIELNSTDAATLVLLKGIGPAFAKRILNYRNALGGFVSVEQLKEVYGLPDSVYRQISPRLLTDTRNIKLINVNTATEAELAQHPYIRKWLASDIIKLRNGLKTFTEIAQIRQVPLINDEKYRKIAPYLSTH
jgi:competence protein ComEA